MNLKLKSIHISNFLSYGEADIVLDQSGYTTIEGINNNSADNSKSNGAGKSTCAEAIFWALTGSTIRGIKDVTNLYGADGALVTLKISADNKDVEITRTKGHSKFKNNLFIKIDGVDKSGKGIKDSQKLLEEYFPDITEELLGSVIILGQGLPHKFTGNTPSGRKELLEKLSKSDFMLDDLKQRISDRYDFVSTEARKAEDAELSAQSKITVLMGQIDRSNAELAMLDETNVDDLQKQINAKLKELNDLAELHKDIEANMSATAEEESKLSDQLEPLNVKLNALHQDLAKIATDNADLVTKQTTEMTELSTKWNATLDGIKNIIARINAELASANAELTKMQNITDVCPTCGQKLPGVFKPDTTELEKRIADLTKERSTNYTAGNEIVAKHEEAKTALAEQYKPEFSRLAEYKKDTEATITDVDKEITNIKWKRADKSDLIESFKKQLKSNESYAQSTKQVIDNLNAQLTSLEARKTALKGVILANNKEIASLNNDIAKAQADVAVCNNKLDVLKKFKTCIQRDFRGQLLVNVIECINTLANDYSNIIFGDAGSVKISADGNNVDVYMNNRIYESLSGGEKQKVDIIIQFALRGMLCRYNSFSTNCLFLDEIFDGLDEYATQRVLDLISMKLDDVESVYVISHHSDLQIPTDHKIIVTKSDIGVSTVSQS